MCIRDRSEGRDDAAVYDLGDGTAVVSTTDFFMPIVDDPVDFGRIAAVKALSDVYAMGAHPLLAISILGWPVDHLPAEAASAVLEGARIACREAGIPIGGGHSIDNPEPIFGLAVTGRVEIDHLKMNRGARAGDRLFLTKPLGVGILTTAQKKGILDPSHMTLARDVMVKPNRIGARLGMYPWVHAMTDVTGFGFLGHLSELCEASGLSAHVDLEHVPLLEPKLLDLYLGQKCIPGGTRQNLDSYGERVGPLPERVRDILFDPQTSGGLLLAVDPAHEADLIELLAEEGEDRFPGLGHLVEAEEPLITVF